AAVAGTVPRAVALLLALGTAVGAAGLLAVETGDGARELAIRGAVVVALALVAAALLLRHAVRRIGGITGDVLGALVEVTTAVVLVLMALG
ncbi:MAG: adenosylcobinamide-GDP ribazoletransferase, partial [Frankiales bacterium]|nr:adenosylcobinamide-GDP ribazoletransferase [Frankiales bacterium]